MPSVHSSDPAIPIQRPMTMLCVHNIHCGEGLVDRQHSNDQYHGTAVIDAVISKRCLKLRRSFRIDTSEQVLGICDLVDQQPDVQPS